MVDQTSSTDHIYHQKKQDTPSPHLKKFDWIQNIKDCEIYRIIKDTNLNLPLLSGYSVASTTTCSVFVVSLPVCNCFRNAEEILNACGEWLVIHSLCNLYCYHNLCLRTLHGHDTHAALKNVKNVDTQLHEFSHILFRTNFRSKYYTLVPDSLRRI